MEETAKMKKHLNGEEEEAEASIVLRKRMKLRSTNGSLFPATISVFECESPYCIIVHIMTDHDHSVRMDVFRDDLARELKAWLDGKFIRNPAIVIPPRIEEEISQFVRLGKTPVQADLIMWILSRSEVTWGASPCLIFGGDTHSVVHGDHHHHEEGVYEEKESHPETSEHEENTSNFATDHHHRTSHASIASQRDPAASAHAKSDFHTTSSSLMDTQKLMSFGESKMHKQTVTEKMHAASQQMRATKSDLLGESQCLTLLSKRPAGGRVDAPKVYDMKGWTSHHFAMVGDLEKKRRDIENAVETRRRNIEISNARQDLTVKKYKTLKAKAEEQQQTDSWLNQAKHELEMYHKIHGDIDKDIAKQKARAHRAKQHIIKTIAPPGLHNRRGTWTKGPVLGEGTIPSTAMAGLKDPALERTMQKYYWDEEGRRHRKTWSYDDEKSDVELAMEAVRKASQNISAYKLDLRRVFDEFDLSGDGFIDSFEMRNVFERLGIKLNDYAADAIFKHFDGDSSGKVDYGEFVWAFFNRRTFLRKWKKQTDHLTDRDIEAYFRKADTTGDGQLNAWELQGMLKNLGIVLPRHEVQMLIGKFDLDGDGLLDVFEFHKYMKAEEELGIRDSDETVFKKSLPRQPPGRHSKLSQGDLLDPDNVQHMQEDAHSTPMRPSSGPKRSSFSRNQQQRRPDTAPSRADRIAARPSRISNPHAELSVIAEGSAAGVKPSDLLRSSGGSNYVQSRANQHASESVDSAIWTTRLLKAQHAVESKLGRQYYDSSAKF